MRGQIIIAGKGAAGQEIMHWLIKTDANGGILVVEEEIDLHLIFLPHAHFDGVGHFEQRMNAAHLPQPDNQIMIKGLLTDRSKVNGFSDWVDRSTPETF